MKRLIFLAILFAATVMGIAQEMRVITLQSGDNTTVFYGDAFAGSQKFNI